MSKCHKTHGNDGAALAKCLLGDMANSPLLKRPAINHEALNEIKPDTKQYASAQGALKTLASGNRLTRLKGEIKYEGRCLSRPETERCEITERREQYVDGKGRKITLVSETYVPLTKQSRAKEAVAQLRKPNEKRAPFFAGQVRPGSLVPLKTGQGGASSPLQREDISLTVLRSGKSKTIPIRGAYVYRPNRALDADGSRKNSAPKKYSDDFQHARSQAKANGMVGPFKLPVDGQHAMVWVSRGQAKVLNRHIHQEKIR